MRKFVLQFTLLIILSLVLSGVSGAQRGSSATGLPLGVLSRLADQVPQDALLYAGIRTDADSISAFNTLISELATGLRGVPQTTVEELFGSTGVSFDEIRPWLGDAIALAVLPRNDDSYSDVAIIMVVHLADRAAAEAYLTPQLGSTAVEWRDDLLIVGDPEGLALLDIAAPSLIDNPLYAGPAGALDAPSYAGLIYLDMPVLIARNGSNSYYSDGDFDESLFKAVMLRLVGTTAIGFTRAENGDLLMDVVTGAPNLNGVRPLGLPLQPPQAANSEALAFVPHDAFAVLQGNNLSGPAVDLWDTFGGLYIDAAMEFMWDEMPRDYSPHGAETMRGLIEEMDPRQVADLIFGNLLGLTLSDLQNWSSSDYVLFAQLNPEWQPSDSATGVLPIEAAGVFRVGRPEQSIAAFENLARTLHLLRDSSGGWEYADLRVTRTEALRRLDVVLYPDGRDDTSVTISLAVSGEMAVLGTSGAVDSALAQAGEVTAPWLLEAAANFRPESAVNGVFQPSVFAPAAAAMLYDTRTADEIRPYLAKLGALSFSVQVAPDYAMFTRFAITLNTAGEMETILGRPTLQPVDRSGAINATQTALAQNMPTAAPVILATPTFTPLPTLTPLPRATEPSSDTGFGAFRGPDGAFSIGLPAGNPTLIVFADWACPHCQNYHPTVEEFLATDVVSGLANFEHRTLPTAGGDSTRVAANLAECVEQARPGEFPAVSNALYDIAFNNFGAYNRAESLAAELGSRFSLDSAELLACSQIVAQAATDLSYASLMGIGSTPALLVRGTDGAIYPVDDRSLEGIRSVLADARAAVPSANTDTTPADAGQVADIVATQAMIGRQTPTPTP
ncbi:MAG: thioredoxin domain-containing protein [Chloroflexi bacterium]|nr:thioredoxin domain-containing protein [Chloroflexota bacterium]